MKKSAIFLVTLLFSVLYAEVNTSGSLSFYSRLRLSDTTEFTWNEGKLFLDFEATPNENVRMYSEIQFSAYDITDINSVNDLSGGSRKKTGSLIDVREAYVDVYGFLNENFDIRAGKQIIAWGTADKLNPTSNLSPYNYEDFLNFGEKEGILALRGTYTQDAFSLEADFVPRFRSAVLPTDEYLNALFDTKAFDTLNINIVRREDFLSLPGEDLKESGELGLRLMGTVKGVDFSLSYFNGYTGVPLLKTLALIPVDSFGNMVLSTQEAFDHVNVVGLDFATSIYGIGFWGEGGVFFPDEFIVKKTFPTYSGMVTVYDTLLKEPYFKYVIGGDYHFKHGFYLNAQFIHGFLHEQGDSLHDYLVFRLEKTFLNDRLKIVPLSGVMTVKKDDVKNTYGIVYVPELSYTPYDDVTVTLGAYFIKSKASNLFTNFDGRAEVYTKIEMEF